MAKPSARPSLGLRRQVSPMWTVIIIAAVIGLALLIGLGGPLWRSLTARTVSDEELGAKGEIHRMGDIKRIACERLGADISQLPDATGGSYGLPVTALMPGAASELQAGDIITGINGQKVVGTGGMLTILRETGKVAEGQQVTVEVLRNGDATTARVTRRASAPAPAAPGRMAPGR